MKVNGTTVPLTLDKGYVTLERQWKAGDVVDLTLPMPVRRVLAHPNVEADRDRVALQRGPIVYAAEWVDNPNGKTRNIVLPDSNRLTTEFRSDLLNGVQVIKGRSVGLSKTESGSVTKAEQLENDESAVAWFYRVLRNAVTDYRRRGGVAELVGEAPEPELEVDLFSLMTAFRQVLERARKRPKVYLPAEQLSIEDRIAQRDALPRRGELDLPRGVRR